MKLERDYLKCAIFLPLLATAGCSPGPAKSVHLPAIDKVVLTQSASDDSQWQHYGGDLKGRRFAASTELTAQSASKLKLAWQYQTGDASSGDEYSGRRSSFKATPILFQDRLIFSTGFNRVIAINPQTGQNIWQYDPEVSFKKPYSEMFTSRGVAAWSDPQAATTQACAHRIFIGTLDARLIALDAVDGTVCSSFGRKGVVDLSRGIKRYRKTEYSVTSPPTVVNGVVVVGSSIGDNGGVALDEGAVRAFDARTGKLRWRFDPIPKENNSPGREDWTHSAAKQTGAGNVWSIMAADAEHDLVYLPTTSPSPDFYGGERPGDNRYANSVVALRATTGELVWAYQIVRHDLWDYDLASQPMLVDVVIGNETHPALVLATKMGFVFVLNRHTGEPLHPVVEQRVPQSDVAGETSAKMQRFAKIQLHTTQKEAIKVWQKDQAHIETCERMLEGVRYEGIFTPPSLEGTLLYPGNPGGVNWGSMAADEASGVAVVALNRLPTVVTLIPRNEFDARSNSGSLNGVSAQFTEQSRTPYGMARYDVYNRENGLPCLEGPWSTLVALELSSGKVLWERPVGVAPGVDSSSDAARWGYVVRGGPIITAGGLTFIATPFDFSLRAHDLSSGDVVWEAKLPAQPGATPMSYKLDGVPYVVVTAGGDRADGQGRGDYVIAFKLEAE